MQHHEIQVFLSVARSLSFSKAAAELGLTSSQVSKAISGLEERLKRKLFLRTTRSVRLSLDGESFLPAARKADDSLQELRDHFQSKTKTQLEGTIRLTAPHTLAHRVLGKPIAGFHRAHPEVSFDFVLSDTYLDLVDQNIDVAFRIMKLSDTSLMAIKLAENPIILCASPKYLKHHKTPTKVSEISEHPVLAIAPHKELKFKKDGRKLSRLAKECWINSTSGDLLVTQALLGQGLLVRSKWGVQEELDRERLIEIQLNDQLVSETAIYMVWVKNRYMPPRVRQFIDFMKGSVADEC